MKHPPILSDLEGIQTDAMFAMRPATPTIWLVAVESDNAWPEIKPPSSASAEVESIHSAQPTT
ncbi:hypothetical protein PCASD_14079 [Puccinia coronata f. sp. avenae]|uniref:Uncharacterized protein n=1 Tax=Puccinia coronata f. sp. avenae TaxID=200324 RepID=A0A2N5TBW3_9BASI|nr:hypothetical protein PCASD_14079 [Puccinia coronata f. sp. avenae]